MDYIDSFVIEQYSTALKSHPDINLFMMIIIIIIISIIIVVVVVVLIHSFIYVCIYLFIHLFIYMCMYLFIFFIYLKIWPGAGEYAIKHLVPYQVNPPPNHPLKKNRWKVILL